MRPGRPSRERDAQARCKPSTRLVRRNTAVEMGPVRSGRSGSVGARVLIFVRVRVVVRCVCVFVGKNRNPITDAGRAVMGNAHANDQGFHNLKIINKLKLR